MFLPNSLDSLWERLIKEPGAGVEAVNLAEMFVLYWYSVFRRNGSRGCGVEVIINCLVLGLFSVSVKSKYIDHETYNCHFTGEPVRPVRRYYSFSGNW